MFRYKLTIEYDGLRFCGWQRQKAVIPSVQEAIEAALCEVFGYAPLVEGAGRTDSGVHALGQVAHCDLQDSLPEYRIQDALNRFLAPKGASVIAVEAVPSDFHARFSATSRSYVYKICNRRPPTPLSDTRAWHIIQPLNIKAMQEAALALIGTHDFSSFRASACQAPSPIKTLEDFTFTQIGEQITVSIQARSFLHNQVRIMVGTCVKIGLGRWPTTKMQEILEAKNRCQSGLTAPPHGLYLAHVSYES
ncbi:MAG: tRNA pseudouridine(38-40) synthase TruA [Alphaproteobacteria bacterium]